MQLWMCFRQRWAANLLPQKKRFDNHLRLIRNQGMAKKRTGNISLTKTFDRSAEIIYLIGDDFTIRYANPACATWIGIEADQLVGAKCVFSSESENASDNVVAGLCPPPDLFETTESPQSQFHEFLISVRSGQHPSETCQRTARAFRINDQEGKTTSILVVATESPINASTSTESLPETDAMRLHNALVEIHHQSQLAHQADSLVGVSSFSHRLRRQAKIAAECTSDLLVLGPPGSGREHLARTIHSMRSAEAPGLLIPIHCSIADQELLQSAISETLAQQKRSQRTKDSTPTPWLLLLDIDKLNSSAQSKLLEFLQLPDFPLKVLSTATTSLNALAEAGQFNAELSHYLNTMTIELIALNQRIEDIPLLAQAMIERVNLSRQQQLSGIDPMSMQLLQEFAWSGNLDQLREVVTAAISEASSSLLTADDLPKKFHDLVKAQRIGVPTETEIQLADYLETIEQELISRALQQAKGNKSKAAKLLGINRAKLLRRMQHFRLKVNQSDPDVLEDSAFEEID
jgi:DNA-binding NtrC family response regulator